MTETAHTTTTPEPLPRWGKAEEIWRGLSARWRWGLMIFAAVSGLIYLRTRDEPRHFYDYAFRIAQGLLHGEIGMKFPQEGPPAHLNECIYLEHTDTWTSGYPLGSVMMCIPTAAMANAGWFDHWPAEWYVALAMTLVAWMLPRLGMAAGLTPQKSLLLTIIVLFGSWWWPNFANGDIAQTTMALGCAGEVAALYYVLADRHPLRGGLAFAIAWGHRTEVAPLIILFYLMLWKIRPHDARPWWREALAFTWPSLVLGVLTMAYNYARFGTPFEFGHGRVPAVVNPHGAYEHGLFSLKWDYFALNGRAMFLKLWVPIERFPWWHPEGFGGSVFLACPFLLLLFARRPRQWLLWGCAWTAMLTIIFILFSHGEAGAWQYSYRYSCSILPWVFLLWTLQRPARITWTESLLSLCSITITLAAVYCFHWTKIMESRL